MDAYLALAPALLADGRPKPKSACTSQLYSSRLFGTLAEDLLRGFGVCFRTVFDTLTALPLPFDPPAPAPTLSHPSAGLSTTPTSSESAPTTTTTPAKTSPSASAAAAALTPAVYRAAAHARSKLGNPLPPSFPPSATSSSSGPVDDAKDDALSYPVFDPLDTSGLLPPSLAALLTLGARAIGFSDESVGYALGTLERRLVRKEEEARRARRRERAEGEGGEGVEGKAASDEMDVEG